MMKNKTTKVEPGWYTLFVFLMGMLTTGLLVLFLSLL